MNLGSRFNRLWLAAGISNVGDGLHYTAIPLLAASITRDPVELSWVEVALFLPWLLFALPAGAWVDRVDRRRAMAVSGAARAIIITTLAGIVVAGEEGLAVVYVAVFLLGSAETVYESSARALLPAVVRREQLDTGNARLQGSEVIGQQFIGPPLAGLLFAAATGLPFVIDAALLVLSSMVLSQLRGNFRPAALEGAEPTLLRADILEGLRWLRGNQLILRLTLLAGIVGLVGAGANAVLVLFALEELDLSETGFGILLAVSAVGSVIGAAMAPRLAERVGRGNAILVAVAGGGVGFFVFAATSNAVVASLSFALVAWSVLVWNILSMSIRQAVIPEVFFGRVLGAWRVVVWGTIPVGAVLGGLLADRSGLHAPFVAAGFAHVGVIVFGWKTLRRLPVDAEANAEPDRLSAAGGLPGLPPTRERWKHLKR
jgi:MFS family permease